MSLLILNFTNMKKGEFLQLELDNKTLETAMETIDEQREMIEELKQEIKDLKKVMSNCAADLNYYS